MEIFASNGNFCIKWNFLHQMEIFASNGNFVKMEIFALNGNLLPKAIASRLDCLYLCPLIFL